MERDGFLPIGKIVGVHGVKGNLKIKSYTESLSAFEPGSRILVENRRGTGKHYTINWVKPHQQKILLALEEINDRDQAENLTGSELYLDKKLLPEPEDGSFYWFQLIGSDVFSLDGTLLGSVESIIPTGSNDVYVVKNKQTDKEILIPAIKSVVMEIDVENRKMIVDLPEGL